MAARYLTTNQDWIEAGYDALGQGGFDSVAVERIADQLGVSKAGFYHRFADRQELLDAIIEHWVTLGTAHFDRCSGIEDPDEQLRQVGYDVLTDQPFRSADAWLLLHALDDPGRAERIRLVRAQTMEWSTDLLRALGFDEPTARTRSHFVYVGYLGLIADIEAREKSPDDTEIRVLVDQLIDLATAPAVQPH